MTQKPLHGSENSSKSEQYLMETLMSEALSKSNPTTSKNTRNVTSLPVSADGHTPYNLPDGLPTDPCGQDHAHASRSASQERERESMTNGTSGPCLPNSSEPASLQQCLGSRLRQRLGGTGSPEYSLTWKEWAINGQEPICALRASALRIYDNDCSGWPTPRAQEPGKTSEGYGECLEGAAQLAGWPTPIVNDVTGSTHCYGKMNQDGTREVFLKLPGAAKLSNAETGKPVASRLNPLFSLWLMGYPAEWGYCGAQAMQSFPKSRRSSSLRSLTQPSNTPQS